MPVRRRQKPVRSLLAARATVIRAPADPSVNLLREATLLPALLAAVAAAQAPPAPAFSFDALRQRARELSSKEYVPAAVDDLPEWLAKMDYDAWRRIRFRTETALWAGDGLPFRLTFAHRGYLFRRRVRMHAIDGGEVRELPFSREQYQYGLEPKGEVPAGLGYAGVTVLHPLDPAGPWDEVASFLGASFFRVLGRRQRYGASARGLAIDTASPDGEEYPEFTDIWIERPAPQADRLLLYALLDSPSTTGAFRFVLKAGEQTVVEVGLSLYPRRAIAKLGLAPMTSMFLHGEGRQRLLPDYRPEVHDSDGVLLADAAGGFSWRPLQNPPHKHRVTAFPLDDPRGFGLLQRDREFGSYQDLEARYELRPGYWVAPVGKWGKGSFELLEIPSTAEGNDNVSCYWVPAQAPAPGAEFHLEYTLSAFLDDAERPPLARVRATRTQAGKDWLLVVLDFDGAGIDREPAQLQTELQASAGELRNVVLQPNVAAGGMRCSFELHGADAAELRCWLRREQRPVTETWVLHWQRP